MNGVVPRGTLKRPHGASRHVGALLSLGLALVVAACRCEDAPSRGVVPEPAPEDLPVVVLPPDEPEPVPEPAADGVDVPITLLRQLERPVEPAAAPTELSLEVCLRGCALRDSAGRLVVIVARGQDARGEASSLEIARPESDAPPRVVELAGADGVAERVAELRRALGDASDARVAADLITVRARTLFAREEHSPLVALGAELEGRWLFAETAETSTRIHLLRSDRSVDRVLLTLPLRAAACDAETEARACVAPVSIDAVWAARDGGALFAAIGNVGTDEGVQLVRLPLDDASALDPEIGAATRAADEARSMATPGAPPGWTAGATGGSTDLAASCLPACVRYRADGSFRVVTPTRVVNGRPWGYTLQVSEAPVPGGTEIVPGSTGDASAALAHAFEDEPGRPGRPLVERRATGAFAGLAVVPVVELRAPHAPRRIEARLEGDEIVLRWLRASGPVEAARGPAHDVGGRPVPPSIVEVYAPPTAGFPLVVVLASPDGSRTDPSGVAHALGVISIPE